MTEPRWLNGQEQRAWRGLMAMEESLVAFVDRRLRTGCGLSHADYQVLAHLSEAPDGRLRSFELGVCCTGRKADCPNISRMQTRGRVVRERSQADQRGAVVTITPQGLELISVAARQHLADARDAVIDQLTQTELKTLATITGKVGRRLATLDPAP